MGPAAVYAVRENRAQQVAGHGSQKGKKASNASQAQRSASIFEGAVIGTSYDRRIDFGGNVARQLSFIQVRAFKSPVPTSRFSLADCVSDRDRSTQHIRSLHHS
jgi:hypothetical protein